MNNEFTLLLSEEQLGAFLEGNLSESDNIRIRNLISHDDSLKEILDINDIVDESIKQFETSGFQFDKDFIDIDSFELPIIEMFEIPHVDSFDLFDTNDEQNEEQFLMNGNEYTSLNIEDIDTFNPENTSNL